MTGIPTALEFAHGIRKGVLTTLRRDGRAQLSNVGFVAGPDGSPVVSVTDDRAKTRNVRRDPRCALHVTDGSFAHYVVLDGTAAVTPAATHPDDDVADALVAYYRGLAGEHDDWQQYRAAMVAERRCLLTLTVTSAYGWLG
ncbi:MAG: PPOX class F420-dependent oxidoreductase [Dermatophilaceae bacterium]